MRDLVDELKHALRERYLIERELGQGGMALVFLARDRRYERPVAIKVLDPAIATAVGAERFLREIRITAQLQHPHIVPLLDSGEVTVRGDDGPVLLYSVMAYIEGESLRDRLMTQGRLHVAEAVSIASEVADALDYAHKRQVVHRDIKPENILISNGHAVVADFGIARALGLAGGATLTGVGFPIGTAAYMSPEQATAASPVDGRSDIYSLGCVLYEMLAGRMAFSGPNLKSVLTQQLTTDPPVQHISHPDVPPPLIAIVRRCMAKQPTERYQDASELLEALRQVMPALPRISAQQVAQPSDEPEAAGGSGRLAWAGRWLIPAALLASAAVGATILLPGRNAGAGLAEPPGPYTASVAVLPFTNLNGDPTNEYFSEGITEEIISQLAQVESLKVISRTSVMALKGTKLTLPQIAETLGVRHLVEGSVRREGDRVRVTAQLIEARSDAHLWAGSFEGSLADSFRVQEEIARKVSSQLVSGLRSGVRPMPEGSMPAHSAAFDAVLRGRYLLERRTAESMAAAIEAFKDAVRLDTTYAAAYAGLSSAYSVWVIYGYRGRPDRYLAAARARAAADRAIALDPGLAAAHHALADALDLANAPEATVMAALRDAQRLMPNSAEVQMGIAFALSRANRHEQSLAQAQRALSLDPLATGLRHGLIILALSARRYDVAFEEARRARGFAPGDPVPVVLMAYALLLRGEPERCAGLDLGPWLAVRAMCLHAVGRVDEAKRLADSLATSLLAGEYRLVHQYADLAAYHAWLGDAGGAVEWMERGAKLTPFINYWQINAGLFDRVAKDLRFTQGLARVEAHVRTRVDEERRKLDRRAG